MAEANNSDFHTTPVSVGSRRFLSAGGKLRSTKSTASSAESVMRANPTSSAPRTPSLTINSRKSRMPCQNSRPTMIKGKGPTFPHCRSVAASK